MLIQGSASKRPRKGESALRLLSTEGRGGTEGGSNKGLREVASDSEKKGSSPSMRERWRFFSKKRDPRPNRRIKPARGSMIALRPDKVKNHLQWKDGFKRRRYIQEAENSRRKKRGFRSAPNTEEGKKRVFPTAKCRAFDHRSRNPCNKKKHVQ